MDFGVYLIPGFVPSSLLAPAAAHPSTVDLATCNYDAVAELVHVFVEVCGRHTCELAW